MKNFLLGLIFLTLSLLFLSCDKCITKSDRTNEEIQIINEYLENEVEMKYNLYFKKISGCENYFRGDSIYIIGNLLCDNMKNNTMPDNELVEYFYREVEIQVPEILMLKYNKENALDISHIEQLKIRILQNKYLNQVILYNMKSNFQLALVGLEPQIRKSKYGILNEVDLRLKYENTSTIMEPLVIIENDTLKKVGSYYKFKHLPKKHGTDTIYAKIIAERWGEIHDFNAYFLVNVE